MSADLQFKADMTQVCRELLQTSKTLLELVSKQHRQLVDPSTNPVKTRFYDTIKGTPNLVTQLDKLIVDKLDVTNSPERQRNLRQLQGVSKMVRTEMVTQVKRATGTLTRTQPLTDDEQREAVEQCKKVAGLCKQVLAMVETLRGLPERGAGQRGSGSGMPGGGRLGPGPPPGRPGSSGSGGGGGGSRPGSGAGMAPEDMGKQTAVCIDILVESAKARSPTFVTAARECSASLKQLIAAAQAGGHRHLEDDLTRATVSLLGAAKAVYQAPTSQAKDDLVRQQRNAQRVAQEVVSAMLGVAWNAGTGTASSSAPTLRSKVNPVAQVSAARTKEPTTKENLVRLGGVGAPGRGGPPPKKDRRLPDTMAGLTVHVVEGRDLVVRDVTGASDPYVCLIVGNTVQKKTGVKKRTLDPVWEETHTVSLQPTHVDLRIEVWDEDRIGKDDFMGECTVDILSLGIDEFGEGDGSDFWLPLQARTGSSDTIHGEVLLRFGVNASNKSFRQPGQKPARAKNDHRQRINQCMAAGGEELDWHALAMTTVPTDQLRSCHNITTLDLSFNQLTAFPSLTVLQHLEVLRLSANQLQSLSGTDMGRMTQLRELFLNGNQLTSLSKDLGELIYLERLDLGNNQLDHLVPHIKKLRRLEELSITGNPIAKLPKEVGQCVSMEVLDASCCNLTDLPAEFCGMTRLIELNLGTNNLRELPASFGRMTRLVELNLSDNQLRDLPVSMGYNVGLKVCNVTRNPFKNQEILAKFEVGTDHLVQWLEQRMIAVLRKKGIVHEAVMVRG